MSFGQMLLLQNGKHLQNSGIRRLRDKNLLQFLRKIQKNISLCGAVPFCQLDISANVVLSFHQSVISSTGHFIN
jgi:hypothetical protein